jgi:integrase/recombinase XerC
MSVHALPTPSSSIGADWLPEWTSALRGSVSPATLEVYLRAVRQFLAYLDAEHPGVRSAGEVKRAHVEAWLADQTADGRSAATRSKNLKALSRFFAYVVDEDGGANPCERVARPRVEAPHVAVPSDDVVRALLALTDGRSFVDRRDHALIRLLADSGLRRNEAVSLDLEDVDVAERAVLVRFGKGGKTRVAAIGDKTAVALSRYLRTRRGYAAPGETALFVSTRGRGRMTGGAVAEMLRRRCVDLGVDPIHPHQLRHLATHAMLEAGLGEQIVEHQLGWTGGQMVRRYGRALAAERSRKAVAEARVGDRL